MPDERRPAPPSRGPRDRGGRRPAPSAPMTGPIVIDDATTQALQMFNARLAHQADLERAERRVQKMARAKDDAAARVRALENDPKATAADRAEAAAAYRAAVEAWDRARNGEAEPAPAPADAASDDTDTGEAATGADDAASDTAEGDTAEGDPASAAAEVVEEGVLERPVEAE